MVAHTGTTDSTQVYLPVQLEFAPPSRGKAKVRTSSRFQLVDPSLMLQQVSRTKSPAQQLQCPYDTIAQGHPGSNSNERGELD